MKRTTTHGPNGGKIVRRLRWDKTPIRNRHDPTPIAPGLRIINNGANFASPNICVHAETKARLDKVAKMLTKSSAWNVVGRFA